MIRRVGGFAVILTYLWSLFEYYYPNLSAPFLLKLFEPDGSTESCRTTTDYTYVDIICHSFDGSRIERFTFLLPEWRRM